MLRSPRVSHFNRDTVQKTQPNQKLSFNCFSKSKEKNNIVGELKPKFGNLFSNHQILKLEKSRLQQNRDPQRQSNKENNEYRLFTNILKSKEKRQEPLKGANLNSGPLKAERGQRINSQYFGASPKQKNNLKAQREESKNKIQKYFIESPNLIRSKNNSTIKTNQTSTPSIGPLSNCSSSILCKEEKMVASEYYNKDVGRQKNDIGMAEKKGYQFSVRNSLDDVNTSKQSLKFDMSPFFNH